MMNTKRLDGSAEMLLDAHTLSNFGLLSSSFDLIGGY